MGTSTIETRLARSVLMHVVLWIVEHSMFSRVLARPAVWIGNALLALVRAQFRMTGERRWRDAGSIGVVLRYCPEGADPIDVIHVERR